MGHVPFCCDRTPNDDWIYSKNKPRKKNKRKNIKLFFNFVVFFSSFYSIMHRTKKARPTSFPRHANVIRLQLYIHAPQWVDKIVYQTSETKKNAQKIHANFASTAKSCWTKPKRECLHSFCIFKYYCKMPDTKSKTKQAKYFFGSFIFVFVESVSTHFFLFLL